MARGFSWWISIICTLTSITSVICESLLCGPTQELKLHSTGRTSAVSLTLANKEDNSTSEPCSLNIFAPDSYAMAFRIIDAKDFEITSSWNVKKNKSPMPPDCSLQIFNFDTKKQNKKSSAAKVSPCASKYPPLEMMPPAIRVEWWPPKPPKNTNHLRLIVTAVNTGLVCKNDDQVVCLSAGEKPLLCVSEALACDGVKHCPEGAEDEAILRCGRKRFSWIEQLVRRVISKHGDFINIDESQFTPEQNTSTNTTTPPKKKSIIAAFDSALAPYGPWAHMLVGTFICAMAVALFSLWECLCHRTKPPQEIPPECEAPAAVILETPRCSSRPPRISRANPPPSYETIESPPPSYSLLFPQSSRKSSEQSLQEASTSTDSTTSNA